MSIAPARLPGKPGQCRQRVLLGLREIAGYTGRLKEGFEEIGAKCTLLDFKGDLYRHNSGPAHRISRVAQKLQSAARRFARTPAGPLCRLAFFLLRLGALAFGLARHDVFIFVYGESFFSLRELFLYRLAGKKLVFIFLGSDSRPLFLNGFVASRSRGMDPDECYRQSMRQKERLRRIERFADVVVSHPPYSQYLERPFIPVIRVGIPCLVNKRLAVVPSGRKDARLRIVHAPSFPECKGTEQVREIVAKLKDRGEAIEYVEISGRPHEEVLRELADCDLVIDELYSDTCLAGLATEAASFGKPSIIGSYADYMCLGLADDDARPPSVFVRPEAVPDAVEELVRDSERLRRIGEEARRFVSQEWSPKKVAARLLYLAMNEFPREWLFDPGRIDYFHGWGFPVNAQRAYLRKVLGKHAVETMGISDKPRLMAAIVKFCTDPGQEDRT